MILTIDSRMINSSGIGTYLRNLIRFLAKQEGFFLSLIGNSSELNQFKNQNVKIVPARSTIYSISEQFEIPRKLRKTDICWSPHYNVPIIPVRSKKRVVTIHDVNHLALSESLKAKQKLYSRFMMRKAVSLSDKIVTVSNFSKSEIIKYTGISDKKVKVIYNGVEQDRYRIYNDNELFLKIRKRYALSEKYILFVGNVKPHKNLRNLLFAFQRFIQFKSKDYYLVIVGKKEGFITKDHQIYKILESDVNIKEKVIFTGYVEENDLPIIYNLASLFVFPSLYEGFGLPPLEAMASGCPVIVSNTTSLPEICEDAACYVNPEDGQDIMRRISEVIYNENYRKQLIEKGLKRVKRFSWDESAGKHIELFNEVIQH